MTRDEIIDRWARYGVRVEQDAWGYWSWAETDENGNENGPFSPPFARFEDCISDIEWAFGPLKAQP